MARSHLAFERHHYGFPDHGMLRVQVFSQSYLTTTIHLYATRHSSLFRRSLRHFTLILCLINLNYGANLRLTSRGYVMPTKYHDSTSATPDIVRICQDVTYHMLYRVPTCGVLNNGGSIAASCSGNFDATSAYLCVAHGSTLAIPRVVRHLQAARQVGLSWTSMACKRCEVYYLRVAPADRQAAWL
jgi:hypothetical protein